MDDVRSRALKTWMGYGSWSAHYWFVGMEPGGDDDLETYASWLRLGGTDLIDLRAHNLDWNAHVAADIRTRWFDATPRIQRTWSCLIRLLLAFEGYATDTESVREYQAHHWGTLEGDTALIEISAAASPSIKDDVAGRGLFAARRSDVLATKLREGAPRFVVFYGTTYRDAYSRIVGAPFSEAGYARSKDTLCVLVPHPRVRPAAQWWHDKGCEIRAVVDAC